MLGIGDTKNDGFNSLRKMTARDNVFLAERLRGTGTTLGCCDTGTDRFGSTTVPSREDMSMVLPPRTFVGTPADLLGISNIYSI